MCNDVEAKGSVCNDVEAKGNELRIKVGTQAFI